MSSTIIELLPRESKHLAVITTMAKTSYLVIGGSGFLGSYIVQALVDRGEQCVAVYDLARPRGLDVIKGVSYFCGDILDEKRMVECLKEVCPLLS